MRCCRLPAQSRVRGDGSLAAPDESRARSRRGGRGRPRGRRVAHASERDPEPRGAPRRPPGLCARGRAVGLRRLDGRHAADIGPEARRRARVRGGRASRSSEPASRRRDGESRRSARRCSTRARRCTCAPACSSPTSACTSSGAARASLVWVTTLDRAQAGRRRRGRGQRLPRPRPVGRERPAPRARRRSPSRSRARTRCRPRRHFSARLMVSARHGTDVAFVLRRWQKGIEPWQLQRARPGSSAAPTCAHTGVRPHAAARRRDVST